MTGWGSPWKSNGNGFRSPIARRVRLNTDHVDPLQRLTEPAPLTVGFSQEFDPAQIRFVPIAVGLHEPGAGLEKIPSHETQGAIDSIDLNGPTSLIDHTRDPRNELAPGCLVKRGAQMPRPLSDRKVLHVLTHTTSPAAVWNH